MTRIFNRPLRFAAEFILACAFASHAHSTTPRASTPRLRAEGDPTAQQPADKSSAGKRRASAQAKGQANAKARADRERRQAVALLLETADAARPFDDRYHSAKIQALAADAVWAADAQSAHVLFRRAWEAATESDLAAMKEMVEESGPDGNEPHLFTDARAEVISVAARHEPRLAETFFRELMKSQRELGSDPKRSAETSYAVGPFEGISVEGWQRLQHAGRLLVEGEPRRAAALAAPAASEGASRDLLSFLLELRAQAPAEADAVYLRLLERTRADASADANDVLLLSAYVLSPDLLTTIDAHGSVEYRSVSRGSEAAREGSPAPQVRAAFFDTAAGVLLRPSAPPAEGDEAAVGKTVALYFATGRLLPSFDRESPRHAPALHARLQSLAADIEAERRERLSSQMEVRKVTPNNPTDPLAAQLEHIANLPEGDRRDRLRFQFVERAAELKMWDRARGVAESITQTEERRQALLLVTAHQLLSLRDAYSEREEQDYELAARFVRDAAGPPVALAYGMAQAAELAHQRNRRERALELLAQAAAYAGQAERGGEQRAVAFAVVTLSAARIDAGRAWEALAEFVRAANALDDYVGDEVSFQSESDGEGLGGDHYRALRAQLSSFGLAKVFAAAARLDLARALEEARALTGEVPRAYALVAAARARLEGGAEVRRGVEKQ